MIITKPISSHCQLNRVSRFLRIRSYVNLFAWVDPSDCPPLLMLDSTRIIQVTS